MKNIKEIINLDADPFDLFLEWFREAKKSEINDPNAMCLSTVSKDQRPSSRMVLMKSIDSKGLIFNTNLKSKKSNEILKNKNVSLNFHWKSIDKQVRIEGKAIEIKKIQADYYFNNRPKGSKVGAWASEQSQPLDSMNELIERVKRFSIKFRGKKIPRPKYWSGFLVIPSLFEFWQGREFRLHERVQYTKYRNKWESTRLNP